LLVRSRGREGGKLEGASRRSKREKEIEMTGTALVPVRKIGNPFPVVNPLKGALRSVFLTVSSPSMLRGRF